MLNVIPSEADLAAAFTEWDRRFREEPERFQSEAVRLLKSTPESYGEACAPYLHRSAQRRRLSAGRFHEGDNTP